MFRRFPILCAQLIVGCVIPSIENPGETSGAASDDAGSEETGETGSESDTSTSSSGTAESGPEPTSDPTTTTTDPEPTTTGPDTTTGAECDPDRTGTIYAEHEYETEDPQELFVEPVATSTYLEGECWQGSNCWQVNPNGSNGNEDHAGWNTPMLPPLADGGTQTMFVGHLLYVSSGMIELMAPPHRVGGKMLDAYQHDQPDGFGPTRQTVIWSYANPEEFDAQFGDTAASGVVPALVKGGAGHNYIRQVGETQFDLQDYPDQWIWLEFEFNAAEGYTAMWVKTQDGVFNGAHCDPVMHRSADDPEQWRHSFDQIEEPYVYVAEGWQTPGLAWGYWDDLDGKPLGEDDFVRVDNLVVSDAWIPPPF
jgi:hypothetical protein